MRFDLAMGTATAIGSLPHRDADEAAAFAFEATPDLPTIPNLPHRSGAEGMLAQAVVGTSGVTVGQYGAIAVDCGQVVADPVSPPDLDHDSFGGFRAFITEAQRIGYRGPVKWQFAGPLTLGTALIRAGVEADDAFDVAGRTIASHLQYFHRHLAEALPQSPQLIVIDEPALDDARSPTFPLAPDAVVDLMSSTLAAVELVAMTGVHCCADADWATVIAAGPDLISLPVRPDVVNIAGYLARYLEHDGIVMWGVVPSGGPLGPNVERPWRELMKLWSALIEGGCDQRRLFQQAMISPVCGFGLHAVEVARTSFVATRTLAERVRHHAVNRLVSTN